MSTGSAVGSCRSIEHTVVFVEGDAGEDHAADRGSVRYLIERCIDAPQKRVGASHRLSIGSSSRGLLRQWPSSRPSARGRTAVINGSRSTQKIPMFPAIRFLPWICLILADTKASIIDRTWFD